MNWDDIANESVELFRGLLRIDTTNPPGAEKAAAEYLAESLVADGLDPWIVESAPGRANLVVRLPATTKKVAGGPLLLAGHTDVVPADAAEWRQPPFGAELADGCIWGRGAVDMKNMVSMSVMTAKLLARSEAPRNRDLIVACVADEEEGCAFGSRFLVEEHPDRVRAEFAIGEVGGFWLHVGDVTYMPIMVAEKGQAHLKMRAHGPPGHASMPRKDSSVVRLSAAIAKLGENRLPHHLTATMANFLDVLAATQKLPNKLALPQLGNPRLEELLLDKVLPPDLAVTFGALLHNTASPTLMNVGQKRNVIPSEAMVEIDARTLPGSTAKDLVREMHDVIRDPDIEIEIVSETPPVELRNPDSILYQQIRRTVARHAPDVVVVPSMIPGYTDGQYFSRLGAKFYGCTPLALPRSYGIKFAEMFHGVDERVPREGYVWGQRVLFDIVSEFLHP